MKTIIHVLFAFLILSCTGHKHEREQNAISPSFTSDIESFGKYRYPVWFRDAKFGIWAHWVPQIMPLQGEKWDPDKLMSLYKRVGARYFVSVAIHNDNFFLWDSKIHQSNSVQMGPKKDVVGLWQKAAQKEGLRFGISERHKPASADDFTWSVGDTASHRIWLNAITEVIDMYQPDLVYSDGELPFGETGRKMLAHFYNQNIIKNAGKLEAVYTCKHLASEGRWVRDIERGAMDSISIDPWQTDTSIGDWYYRTGQKYMSATEVIRMLVDIVSKNGNLLLNVVQTPEGDLEQDVISILEEIARWTPVNGEGIYGTRPWKVYGEGPSMKNQAKGIFGDVKTYKAADIRFTIRDHNIYAFCMERPEGDVRISSLGRSSPLSDHKIKSVSMLGSQEKLDWKQYEDALIIMKPEKLPAWNVIGFRIVLRD